MRIHDYMTGSSPVFLAFAADLERVAASDVTVLVEGENGSGKSLAAAAIHGLGPRAGAPLVTVQLAALAPTLLESELFGHEEGSFTGAARSRAGRFRAAHGGTLVLDAVDTLPLELQVKLLRALQERAIEPIGAEAAVPVDVRVVATSGRDLQAEVAAGRFREDLYYRLAVVTLRVPPLRARPEDVRDLAARLSAGAARRAGVPPRELSPAAVERLRAHAWPGNVRELENALERVMVLRPAGGDDVPAVEPDEFDFLAEAVEGAEQRLARLALGQGLTLERLTAALLQEALAEQRGNVSAAARQVGLSRRAFEYRRKRMVEGSNGDGDEA